jgi:hypothetical protein
MITQSTLYKRKKCTDFVPGDMVVRFGKLDTCVLFVPRVVFGEHWLPIRVWYCSSKKMGVYHFFIYDEYHVI